MSLPKAGSWRERTSSSSSPYAPFELALLFWVVSCDLAWSVASLAEVMDPLGNEIGIDGGVGDDVIDGSCIHFSSLVPFS